MRLLKNRWKGIPVVLVAVLLALVLVSGGVFAAYNFLSVTTEITVDEPMTVEMRWWDYNSDVWTDWWVVTGESGTDELTLTMSPGEVQTLGIRIFNISYAPLTVATAITGQVGHFTFAGFPNGTIPGSDGNNATPEWTDEVTITADGDTPPGVYTVEFDFTRE